MYSKKEQIANNIDWFFFINEYPIHVASNGSLLPKKFSSVERIKQVWEIVNALPANYEVKYDLNQVDVIKDYRYVDKFNLVSYIKEKMPSWLTSMDLPIYQMMYSWHFFEAARRGFFSFNWDEEENYYILIASPNSSAYLTPEPPYNLYSTLDSFTPYNLDRGDILKFLENNCDLKWPKPKKDDTFIML